MTDRFFGWEQAAVKDANGLTPRDYYGLLRLCWRADTCAPRMRAQWSESNPTLGQCSITAFLVQDLMGGRVFGVPLPDGNFHCYNVVDGCLFDLTSEQFGDTALDYENNPEQFREAHFAKDEKRGRYLLLRERFMGEYAVFLKHRGRNCCQAVLCAYASATDAPLTLLCRLGAAFGVGMGGMEGTCGALCAAETLLGLCRYREAPLLGDARKVHQAFAGLCGGSVCRELKGLDTGGVLCACDDCVRNAARVIEREILGK